MGIKKISQLDPAGSLNGSEVLPIVQGGTTVKATTQAVANLVPTPPTPTQSLQLVTDEGNTTTNDIQVNGSVIGSYVKLQATDPTHLNPFGDPTPSLLALDADGPTSVTVLSTKIINSNIYGGTATINFHQTSGNHGINFPDSSGTLTVSVNNTASDSTGNVSIPLNFTPTQSFNAFTASYNTGSFSGSFNGTASWANNVVPGGSTGNIQYNNTSGISGSSNFTYVSSSSIVSLTGSLSILGSGSINSEDIVTSTDINVWNVPNSAFTSSGYTFITGSITWQQMNSQVYITTNYLVDKASQVVDSFHINLENSPLPTPKSCYTQTLVSLSLIYRNQTAVGVCHFLAATASIGTIDDTFNLGAVTILSSSLSDPTPHIRYLNASAVLNAGQTFVTSTITYLTDDN